jgi:hypothetical protein
MEEDLLKDNALHIVPRVLLCLLVVYSQCQDRGRESWALKDEDRKISITAA